MQGTALGDDGGDVVRIRVGNCAGITCNAGGKRSLRRVTICADLNLMKHIEIMEVRERLCRNMRSGGRRSEGMR